ncbi:MAG: LysR family transcriptional regulator [Rhodanobacteraceae bacterium]|nr:LysR family transcriptional regulator [Rhodanobacteraceae bacterium]
MHDEVTLDLQAIELLTAIEAEGSMAAAARRLGKVPSALSYQVRRLEESLDLLLVDRRSGRALLTESAQLLVREGRDLRAALDGALTRARRAALDGALTRARRAALGFESELVIAVDAVVPIDVLWPLLRGFDQLKAPTQLRFWHEVLSGSWEALLSGRADLVVGAPGEAPANREIRMQPLGRIEFVFCVAPQHPLATVAEPLLPAQIARHRAIAVADSARSMPRRTAGLLPGQRVMTVPDFNYKVAALCAGLGCGYLPRHVAAAPLRSGALVQRATAQTELVAPVHLAWREPIRGKALAWFVQAFTRVNFDSPR